MPHNATHLWPIESHVIAHDVELYHAWPPVPFDPVCVEEERVAKLIAQGQRKMQLSLLSEAVQHVENGAAGCFMGLQEHNVRVGPTRAHLGSTHIIGGQREDRTRPLWLHPTVEWNKIIVKRKLVRYVSKSNGKARQIS